MAKTSAGILMFRQGLGGLEVLLAHPGGPFWRRKDAGAWSIPKGEIGPQEDELPAAIREFAEETGAYPEGAFLPLGELKQAGGKRVVAWAVAGDIDPTTVRSNTFEIVWPPRSGRRESFPEIDRAGWFTLAEARVKILKSQEPFLDRLAAWVAAGGGGGASD
jgi:predicted NUDIX family NTP pyrophosphohydrolase